MDEPKPEQPPEPIDKIERRLTAYQKKYIAIVVVASIVLILFSLLLDQKQDHSALLYVGLPIIVVISIALIDKSESLVAESLKALTCFMVLSVIVIKEGVICVVIAAPILYPITAIFAKLVERIKSKQGHKLLSTPLAAFIILSSAEGTHPLLTFDRNNIVTEQIVIDATPQMLLKALEQGNYFEQQPNWITRIFPKPVSSKGSGLALGDTRTIDFVYYKHIYFSPHVGSTVFQVADTTANSVTFHIPTDTSYISNYLTWQYSRLSWQATPDGKTQLTWQISYQRKLDPAWYFGPLEYFYVSQTVDYLLADLRQRATTGGI